MGSSGRNKKQKRFNDYTEKDRLLEGGEGEAAAEDAPADDKAAEGAPADDAKADAPADERAEEKPRKRNNPDDDDPYTEPILEECCCCECVCKNEATKDSSCCGCFPIKCGVVAIGIFTILITAIFFVWYFFLFLNEYIHWWSEQASSSDGSPWIPEVLELCSTLPKSWLW